MTQTLNLLIGFGGTGKTMFATHRMGGCVRIDMDGALRRPLVELDEICQSFPNRSFVLDGKFPTRWDRHKFIAYGKGRELEVVAYMFEVSKATVVPGVGKVRLEPATHKEGFSSVFHVSRAPGGPIDGWNVSKKLQKVPVRILIEHHKHGEFPHLIQDDAQLYRTVLKIANERTAQGWYDNAEGKSKRIKSAIQEQDGPLVWKILQYRSSEGFEHEGFDLEEPSVT